MIERELLLCQYINLFLCIVHNAAHVYSKCPRLLIELLFYLSQLSATLHASTVGDALHPTYASVLTNGVDVSVRMVRLGFRDLDVQLNYFTVFYI